MGLAAMERVSHGDGRHSVGTTVNSFVVAYMAADGSSPRGEQHLTRGVVRSLC